jgi:hypothetical protein
MHRDPSGTFAIVLKRWGRDAARLLYEQWWQTVPGIGAQFSPLWNAGWQMQDTLGLARTSPPPQR